jgi:hypothetical protein
MLSEIVSSSESDMPVAKAARVSETSFKRPVTLISGRLRLRWLSRLVVGRSVGEMGFPLAAKPAGPAGAPGLGVLTVIAERRPFLRAAVGVG